jgi:hypothetical protein
MQFYSDRKREHEKYALPNCEVFYVSKGEWWYDDAGERCDPYACLACATEECTEHPGGPCEAGWYYWFCFPGCLPDSEPSGPYDSAEAAIAECRELWEDEES